uniref:beta strand repeat-containing protein n=1 Tax=Mucilaginibacter sp. TaxID=1882438 RepID=UPI0025D9041F
MKKCLLIAWIVSAFTLLSQHVQAQNGANITWSCFSASASLANTTTGDVTYAFTSGNCSEAAGFSAEIVGTGALDIRSTVSPQNFLRLQKTGTAPVFSYARFFSTSGGTFKLTGISVAPTSVGATAGGSQSITVHAYKSGSEVGTGVTTSVLSSTSPVAVTLTSNFDNIDEIRLTSSSSTAFGIGIDNVTTATATTVSSLNRAGSTPSNGSTVNYTLTFGAAVTGVTASNFSLTTSGVSGAAVGTPTTGDSGVTWTIPVTTGSGDGNVTLNLANASSLSQAISTTLPFTGQTYSIDKTAPTISIGSPSASITKSGGVSYTVTYSDVNFSSSTLATGNITVNTGGSAAAGSVAVTGSGSTRTVTLSSITGDGTLGISIGSGTATDAAGNSAPASSASTTFTVDNTAPTISIGSPSASLTTGGPVSYTVTYSDAHFNASTLGAGNITVNSTGGNASAGSISVTGSGSTRTVTLSSITGTGNLGISIPANTANDLAGNNAPAAGPSTTFAVDNTAPTVSSIALANTSPTNATSVGYTVTFSESVTGVDQSDFNLVGTGASGSITGFSGSGTSYTVTVSSVSGNGTLRLDLKSSGTGISDAAGNAIAAGFTGQSYTIDTTAPTVLSITQQDGSTTQNGSQIDYSVTFSEPVTGVDATDFVATTTGGVSQGTISLTPVSTTVYNVSITNITGDGTYRLDLKSSGTGITDAVGNAAGGFTTGDVFTIDNTAPTVASIVTASVNPTNATSVDYTVTFSEAVTGVDKNDFTATNVSGSVSGTVSAVSGSGATYTVTVNSITGDGALRLDLNSSGTGITDVVSNPISGGFNTGQTYTIDNTAPTANTLVFASNHSGNQLIAAVGDVVSLSFTTSEPIQAPTVSIAGHSLTATNPSGNDWVASYTMTSGDTEGRIPFSLQFNDNLGNAGALYNDIGAGDDIEFDNTAPTITIGAPSQAGIGSGTAGTVTYTVTYADANFNSSTLGTGDITLNTTGASTATVAVSNAGTTSTVTLSNITGVGTLGISIAAGTASDAAGNLAPAAGPSTVFSVFSSDASLSSLTTSVDPLSPTFDTNTTSGYTASVPNATTTMTVTPTTTDSNVSDLEVRVNGGAPVFVASGTQSAALPLIAGSNTIAIQVTAQDGTTTKTYTITVNRALATNNVLTTLKYYPGIMQTQVGGPDYKNFTATVANTFTSITATPTTQDPTATVTIN